MKHLFLLLTLLSFSLIALAQQKVTGKVKDSSGEPVIGASVVVKGNNTMGTITDFDGNLMFLQRVYWLFPILVMSLRKFRQQEKNH